MYLKGQVAAGNDKPLRKIQLLISYPVSTNSWTKLFVTQQVLVTSEYKLPIQIFIDRKIQPAIPGLPAFHHCLQLPPDYHGRHIFPHVAIASKGWEVEFQWFIYFSLISYCWWCSWTPNHSRVDPCLHLTRISLGQERPSLSPVVWEASGGFGWQRAPNQK